MMESVIINGVRYIPDPNVPDSLYFYYMHDDHTFTKLHGTTLDEILAHADEVESTSSYGMLCQVILMRGDKEVRRVGGAAHSGSSKDPKDKWDAGKAAWKKALEDDADVMRILKAYKEKKQ